LQAIDTRLPPRMALANRPVADDAWLKRAGAADLVPVAEQQRVAAGAAARPLPTARGPSGIAGELGLLAEANRVNLFDGRQRTRTPEQTAFLARATRDNPNASVTLRRFTTEARVMHSANVTAGTAFVVRGVGHAAPSAEVMRRVTAASVRANPGAAALITHHATDSYHGPDRGELNRPARAGGVERPPGQAPRQAPNGRQPNEYERRQPPQQPQQQQRGQPPQQQRGQPPQQQRGQPPQLQRPLPQRGAPRPPPQPPGRKQPPKKKGDERDQNQR